MPASAALPRSTDVTHLAGLIRLRYGITVLDKTDEHSEAVLNSLLFLLENAFSPSELKAMGQIRYLYAYQSHDRRFNIAAFHPEEDAISIGGKLTYEESDGTIESERSLAILSALAHEFGHVFLLKKIPALELRHLAAQAGGWSFLEKRRSLSSLPMDKQTLNNSGFFTAHPLQRAIRGSSSSEQWLSLNMSSAYGAENVHEWFAEAFTAFVLVRLGKKGLLGSHWKSKLVSLPQRKRDFWVNYNNITPALESWFSARLNPPQ